MKIKEYVVPGFGVVVVHHLKDWSSDVTIEWDYQGHHTRTIPAILIDRIGQTINKAKKTRSHHEERARKR